MGSALDSASLIMYPSGYSNGVLGSAKPTDGSGDFTFSRGSNLSATRVAPNGYIEKGYENLLLQSNNFDTSPWINAVINITGGQAGYDGTNDAWLLEVSNNVYANIRQNISSTGVNTFSIYAKAGNTNTFQLLRLGGANPNSTFTLTGDGSATGDGFIEPIGNGWYRCSYFSNVSTSDVRIYITQANTSGSIYIQDAMLNQGLVAYPYVETTTAPVAGGILEDEPRIDFSDGCGHLLLEPQRTNFELSEYFNEPTANQELTITANATTSPEGVVNATRIIDNSLNNYHRFYNFPVLTASSGVSMTHSIFAKADSHSWFQISSGGSTDSQWANFDLTNGVVGNSSASANADIQPMGNGWYRCIINSTTTGTSSSQTISTIISLTNDTNVSTRFHTYSGSGNGIFIWGLQLEIGSYPTSYIPTYGSSQTRLVDSATASNVASLIGQTEGTIFIDVNMNAENGDIINIKPISGSFYANGIGLGNLNKSLRLQVYTPSGFTQVVYPLSVGGRFKFGIRYDSNNLAFFVNGSKFYDNPVTIDWSVNLNDVALYDTASSGSRSVKNNKQLLVFPTALSDEECIALTTI